MSAKRYAIMRVPTSTGMFSFVSAAFFAFDVAQIMKDRTTSRALILKEKKRQFDEGIIINTKDKKREKRDRLTK